MRKPHKNGERLDFTQFSMNAHKFLEANLEAGLVARLLTQKKAHPLPEQTQLEGFDFKINRQQK